jgi:flagellar protein FlgJ
MKAIQSPEFYADLQGLAALKRDAKTQSPEALKEAAKQFESLFTRMLLKSMRSTSLGDSLFDSEQTKFYQDMFDDQMAVHLSQGEGLGLADMLVRQLQQSGMVKTEEKTLTPPLSRTRETGSAALPSRTASPLPLAEEGQGQVHTNTRAKKDAFISAMLPYAERAARKLGVDPHAIVAQAALETGWGQSLPKSANGASSYNLFGIKATAHWNGRSVASNTLEFVAGSPVSRHERFRAYDSPEQSFEDYAALLGRSSRYAAARNTGSDVRAFAQALQDGGYATDPHYARKLSALAAEVRSLAAARDSLKLASNQPLDGSEGVRG